MSLGCEGDEKRNLTHEDIAELFRRESRSLEVVQGGELEESRVRSDVGSCCDGFDRHGEPLEAVEAVQMIEVLQREGATGKKDDSEA